MAPLDDELGSLLPRVHTALTGPRSAALVEILARTECPALTSRRARRAEKSGVPQDPIVWTRAQGANVVDSDDNVFVDCTSGFGVAIAGHRHPRVVSAIRAQSDRLLHALGDVHPSDAKIALLDALAQIAPWPDARVILGLSGSDAIEAALKTAMLATQRPGVLGFLGGYHGLSHGPLAISGYKDSFRAPFAAQLNPHVAFAPFPDPSRFSTEQAMAQVIRAWDAAASPIGAVVIEPVLGRGGVIEPPIGFLDALTREAHARRALVIADEIYTGLGRAGARYAWPTSSDAPDLVCLGKALGGGLPVSACLGREEVMAAWGDPRGEALHTSTFLGNPLGAAAALAALEVIDQNIFYERASALGAHLLEGTTEIARRHGLADARGRGPMVGLVLDDGARTLRLVRALLERGFITLPAGAEAEVLQLAPPATLTDAQLHALFAALDDALTATYLPSHA